MLDTTKPHGVLSPLLRVLLLDDSPRVAKLMVALLESGGNTVQSTVLDTPESYRERLEIAEYDVILADFNLLNWTALDALEILKRSGKDIPLIVLTGALDDIAAAECLKQGAVDYVQKDRLARLPNTVQRVLEEKRLRTENKRAFEVASRLATIVESSDDAIVGMTLEGIITSWNKGAEKLYGYSPGEVLGQPISVLAPPERSEEVAQILARLGRGERLEHFESVRVRKDGSLVDVSLSFSPLTDSRGEVTGVASIGHDITERKRAAAALIEERHLLCTLMDNLPDKIYFKDRESHFTRMNKVHTKLFGLSDPAQAVGKTDFEFFTPEHAQEAYNDEQEIIRTGEPVVGKEEMETWPDGHVTWVSTTKMPLRDAGGNIVGTFGVSRDITERKRAEDELRCSEIRYRSLFEAALDGILILDADSGEIRDVNPFLLDLLGFSHAELLGKKLWDIGPLSDVVLSKIGFGELQDKKHVRYDNLPLETHDGKRLDVEFVSNVYLADHKKVIQCNIRDITERKRVEAEHVRLVTAIEQSAEAVMITNTAGDIEYVNPAFSRITGYSREEALGQNPRMLKSGNQDPALYQQLWATILDGKIWHGELINRRKDGSLYNELMSIAPVRGERGEVTHFIATKQDVTARKQLEQQFVQAQKMEAVGRLAGGVAHDFNNLLTIINGYAQLLTQRSSPDDPRRGLFEEIQMAGERAASLTRQLLAFSRQQVMEPKTLDLSSVLANTEKMLRRLIGEDIELVTTLRPGLGRVKVDPGQIDQVIMNLAVNARDAMPEGGKFLIETSNVEVDEDDARRLSNITPGKYVMASASDTGCGMDLETQAHLFDPFFTTKPQGQGTGLGLATVYGIIKQSGGFIWVYSAPGQGTTFKIYFPCVEEAAPTAEPAKARRPTELAKGKETILVVEDEKGVRSLVCETVKSGSYKVLEAEGAEKALKIAERHTRPIHLLLTDVVMPQTDGKELAKRLSTLHPETRVLYMSGYTDYAVAHHGITDGGTPFLRKPFLPDALLLKVREVLKMKRGLSSRSK